ncbi:MAG: exo-alpha-sialidase, partial [Tannerella sp.]|nr:exo-alpha-sialidase [Tannerella sp.]
DRGITWNLADTLIVLPEDYRARGYASVLVDEEQFLLLFGGKERNGANMLEELWRGRINRLGFRE